MGIKVIFSKNRALDLSSKISLFEVIVFLIIAYLNSNNPNFSWHQFVASSLPILPNLIIAIATTWYVVFTYFILQSSEILRKISTEPFLSINWTHSAKKMGHFFADYELPSKLFSSTFGYRLKELENEKRFINLQLSNVYQGKCGRLIIVVKVSAITDANIPIIEHDIEFSSININLSSNEPKEITVIDLHAFSKNIRIRCKITDLRYYPVDEHVELRAINGPDYYDCYGISEYEESIPTPQTSPGRE